MKKIIARWLDRFRLKIGQFQTRNCLDWEISLDYMVENILQRPNLSLVQPWLLGSQRNKYFYWITDWEFVSNTYVCACLRADRCRYTINFIFLFE